MTFRLAADAKAAQGAEAADFRQWAVGSFIMIARASGWLEPCSSAAARRSTVCSSTPAKVFTATTCGLPSVRVPVLSNTGVEFTGALQRIGIAHQHAILRRPANAGDNRHWRRRA